MSIEVPTSPAHEAFSRQAPEFDEEDLNPIVREWRKKIYAHVNKYLRPGDDMLELNAGTGLDAIYFATTGHRVLATDASEGMISALRAKLVQQSVPTLSVELLSFEHLDELDNKQYHYVFSNFGGLNCIQNLAVVTKPLIQRLTPGAYVTWVIMPRVSPWEIMRIFKGEWKEGTRRFNRNGAIAHLKGMHFKTWYHSVSDVRAALGPAFRLVRAESLGLLSPPPAATRFAARFPVLHRSLRWVDQIFKDIFPFNRMGDHVIVTFQKTGKVS